VLLSLLVTLPSIATCCPPQSGWRRGARCGRAPLLHGRIFLLKAAKNVSVDWCSLLPPTGRLRSSPPFFLRCTWR